MRLRLLPVVAGFAALMLAVRVNDVLDGAYELGRQAAAQNAPAQSAPAALEAKAPEPPKSGGAVKADLTGLTEAEVEVLQGLAQRREALEARARDLDNREAVLKATEQRLASRIKDLEAIKDTVEAKLKQQEQLEESRLRSLVKVYEAMKPKEAARILEQLDVNITLDVLERMKEAKTATLLAAMDPGKAKTITAELATRRQVLRPKG